MLSVRQAYCPIGNGGTRAYEVVGYVHCGIRREAPRWPVSHGEPASVADAVDAMESIDACIRDWCDNPEAV